MLRPCAPQSSRVTLVAEEELHKDAPTGQPVWWPWAAAFPCSWLRRLLRAVMRCDSCRPFNARLMPVQCPFNACLC
jgi:hypothetical protein